MAIFINQNITSELAQIVIDKNISNASTHAYLCLMGGTMPTYAEFDAFTDLEKQAVIDGTDVNYPRFAKAIINDIRDNMYKLTLGTDIALGIDFGQTVDRDLFAVGGTASWFIYTMGPENFTNYSADGFSLIGTVGEPASGADLIVINVTNAVIGQEFLAQDVRVLMPKNIQSI